MLTMSPEELDALLAKPINAIVATTRQADAPQLTPVWFLWDGETFAFSTTKNRIKYGNIKRNPKISLIVDDEATHQYAVAYGHAEIVEQHERVTELTRPLLEKYVPGNIERIDSMLGDASWVVILLRPDKWVTI